MSLYLWINLLSVSVPLIYSFHRSIRFHKVWKAAFPALIITALLFIGWDLYFTSRDIWGFNPRYIEGVYFFNLPVEEVLFFFCIPYACLFTYHTFRLHLKSSIVNDRIIRGGILFVSLVLILIALFNSARLYTFTAFLSSGLLLLLVVLFNKEILTHFVITYLVILIPFFIVNGILTGSFIDQEVVYYNPEHNLQIRVLTIPVEDFFYGMTLIGLNINLFEIFKRSRAKKIITD